MSTQENRLFRTTLESQLHAASLFSGLFSHEERNIEENIK